MTRFPDSVLILLLLGHLPCTRAMVATVQSYRVDQRQRPGAWVEWALSHTPWAAAYLSIIVTALTMGGAAIENSLSWSSLQQTSFLMRAVMLMNKAGCLRQLALNFSI